MPAKKTTKRKTTAKKTTAKTARKSTAKKTASVSRKETPEEIQASFTRRLFYIIALCIFIIFFLARKFGGL